MQQASTATRLNSPAASGSSMSPQSVRNQFVINLCASTTPVALTPPDHAGLKRFTFFVSRRREEGRERFRLHMGYFESQEEAERLLDIVREIYPGAWAGLAPGQRLRAKAEQQAAQEAAQAASPAAASPAATPPAVTPPAATPLLADSPPASGAMSPAAPVAPPAPAPVATAMTATQTTPIAAPAATAPSAAPANLSETGIHRPPAHVAAASAAASETAVQAQLSLVPDAGRQPVPQKHEGAARALSDVRAAIASLADSGTNVAPVLSPLPELKPAVPRARDAAREAEGGALSDTAALKVLEGDGVATSDSTIIQPRPPIGRAISAGPAPAVAKAAQARGASADLEESKAGAEAKPREERTAYAVQLLWSVQPIDIAQIPQLAIFSAYTLYGAEGNRDGRRWYGVRLGFFTDAVSAKQVAHYVRSDFSTVSVVPVTARERERARMAAGPQATPAAAAPAAPTAALNSQATAPATEVNGASGQAFEFIEDKQPQLPSRVAGGAAAAGSMRPTRGAPGKRAKARPGRPVGNRAKSRPMTLEETLEILGAGQLQIDDGRRALINDDTPRGAAPQAKGKSSRFGRLLERLSERLGS